MSALTTSTDGPARRPIDISGFWRLSRPATLPAPALGIASGAAAALASTDAVAAPAGGAVLAASLGFSLLNAGSNALNQVCDLASDAIDKAGRPLPSGQVSSGSALAFAGACYGLGAILAGVVAATTARPSFALLFAVAASATVVYSVPPLRTKRLGWPGLATIAVARGLILFAAGWATVAPPSTSPEPWLVGGVLSLFLLGASATKDFSDVRGDAATGCRSLPVVHGARGAAWRIAPFLVAPWALLILAVWAPAGRRMLHADPFAMSAVAVVLALYGASVARFLIRSRAPAAPGRPHAAWWHMYAMLTLAHVGIAASYLAADPVAGQRSPDVTSRPSLAPTEASR